MPSTIPYDPSLVLGNIVPKDKLETILQISRIQAPADAAQDHLNELLLQKRSIDMTLMDLTNKGIDTTRLSLTAVQINSKIKTATETYADVKLKAIEDILNIKSKNSGGIVSKNIESPVDYVNSQLKQMALASDSLNMNCQYFALDENAQGANSYASSIATFVSQSLTFFGDKQATSVGNDARKQTNDQLSQHKITGTLVICVTCTHKNARVFAPLIIDPDKAVRAWNYLFDSKIKTDDPKSIEEIVNKMETADEESYNIISGATFGSSFVAMVHVLNTTTSEEHQKMQSMANKLQETLDVGGWFATATGGIGVEESFSSSVKNLLSMQNITSHCSIITMGIIPSIKSNQVRMAVLKYADFDPAKSMELLTSFQGSLAEDSKSISASATAARKGQQMVELENKKMKSALSGLAEIDDGQNKIIDTNSMMTALDDYIQKCIAGGDNMGVPINYYLKPVTKSSIARAWLNKYFPNRFNAAGNIDDGKKDNPGEKEKKDEKS